MAKPHPLTLALLVLAALCSSSQAARISPDNAGGQGTQRLGLAWTQLTRFENTAFLQLAKVREAPTWP